MSAWLALPVFASFDDAALRHCLDRMASRASAAGVDAERFAALTGALTARPELLDLLDAQPEFVIEPWDYFAPLVDDERIADGQARWRLHGDLLARIGTRYAVDDATLVALWGIESDYGRRTGERPVLESLATLSCAGRRQDYFRGEFLVALRLVADGHTEAAAFNGSWAGAFGHTQFMPGTFARLAVDFDGDGRRDLVGSVADALASSANFLVDAGWREPLPWGVEVRLPAALANAPGNRRDRQARSRWQSRGVTGVDGQPLDTLFAGDPPLALIRPAGARGGPAFLVSRNFDALYRYNASERYALAIAHLADRLKGAGPFRTAWPTDDAGLSRQERREVQQRLAAAGHDAGPVDGLIGSRTRTAILAYQNQQGLAPDGRAGQRLLAHLRSGTTLPTTE